MLKARQAWLPFYADHFLVDVTLHGVAGVERALLLHGRDRVFWLDGQASPIHAVNALESLELTEATVLDYVRYFLVAMRGEQGAFVLIESPDEITAEPAAARAPRTRRRCESTREPPRTLGAPAPGRADRRTAGFGCGPPLPMPMGSSRRRSQ